MRIVFMGTPDFSVPVLEALLESSHDVAAVFSQPDKPKGRGGRIEQTPVKKAALKGRIPVYQPEKVRDPESVSIIRDLKPDVIVVVAFGQLLPREILDIPPYGCINVHASLLPKLRGAAPIQWAVINGEAKTGITTMYMAEKLDAGDMLLKEEVKIGPEETGGSLHDKLSALGGSLLLKTLSQLEKGTAVRVKQDESQSTYAGMLKKELGKLDFTKSAKELERLIRGCNPWPSAYTSLEGRTLKIWKACVEEWDSNSQPGQIVKVEKEAFLVQTGQGILAVRELQLEGKKRMSAENFLRGFSLLEGTCLS